MDSQTFETLAAAVITAIAGLAGVAMTRRAPYRREQLQLMSEEAELLALLPEDHPMRERLSKLLAIRVESSRVVYDGSPVSVSSRT